MMPSILKPGEKVHIILRRRFDKDVRRHFAGEVEVYESGVARATGYVFVIDDLSKHLFVKRPDKRTKIFSPHGRRADHTCAAAVGGHRNGPIRIEGPLAHRHRQHLEDGSE